MGVGSADVKRRNWQQRIWIIGSRSALKGFPESTMVCFKELLL